MSTQDISEAIKASPLGKSIPSNLIAIMTNYVEIRHIFFCSHKGRDLRAYNVFGDCLGTVIKGEENDEDEWVTGFDFDSKGNLYVANYAGLLSKYPFPSNQCLYSMAIKPRQKDLEFQQRISGLSNAYLLNDDSCAEGVVVVDNDEQQSLFVTVMDPIHGIIQLTLDGIVQRVICQTQIDGPWNMHIIPPFFANNAKNKFMVADGMLLRIVDVGDDAKIQSNLLFESDNDKPIGDFTFFKQHNGTNEAMLIVNLQDGTIQFHRYGMFLMLKTMEINAHIEKYENLEGKEIENAYGLTIGPDDSIYLSDHLNHRVLRIHITDFDMIYDEEQALDNDKVDIDVFIKDIKAPNYNRWCDAQAIGLNFVTFPAEE